MIYIDITDIISDDTLGFTMAIGAPLESLTEKQRDRALTALTEQNIYAQLPGTFVAEAIVNKQYPVTFIKSDVEVIAKQQDAWLENRFKPLFAGVKVCEHDGPIPQDALLISANRRALTKHGAVGGRVLPYTSNTQMEFILTQIENEYVTN